jgi:hypothetical protein
MPRADDAFRAAAYLTEAAKSKSAGRRRPAHAHAFGYEGTYFEWAAIPENLWRGQRVGKAMVQSHSFANRHVPEGMHGRTDESDGIADRSE